MRFCVRFATPSFRLSLGKRLDYMGRGALHLQETGLVADGDLPRFRIPLVDYFYHRILAVRCTRTIPYSAILDHRPVSRWPRWIAKGFVLLVLSLFLAGLIAALVYGGSPVKCGIGIAIVASLALITVFAGRRVYGIVFRDSEGRKCRFCFSVKSKELARQFAQRLAECRRAVAAVEAAGAGPIEAAPSTSSGSPSQEETLEETKDWAPPPFEPFEVCCPDCGRRRKITRPEQVGELVACKACETSYLVRRADQDVRQILAKQAKPPAKSGRPVSDSASRLEAIGVALIHSVVWASVALLACVLMHAAAGARGDAGQFPDVPVIQPLVYGFYYPGTQLYALFIGEPGVWGPPVGHNWWAPRLAVVATCLFWSGMVGFLGCFTHAARPRPLRSPGSTVVLLGKWLPVACGAIVLVWLTRDWLQLRTRAMEQKVEQEAAEERKRQRLAYGPFLQQSPRGARDSAVLLRGSRRQDAVARQVKDCLEKARAFDEQGKFFDAQPHYEKAVGLARGLGRPQDEATVHVLLARNLVRQGKHAKAQERYEEALQVLGDRAGQSREAALVHNDLARSLDAQGKGAEAGAHYERALSLLESREGPKHPDTAVTHMNYAQHLQKRGAHAPARSHFDAALQYFGAAAKARPQEAMACYLGSAANLMALGRYGEAYRHASEASALADEHPVSQLEDLAISLMLQNSLGRLVFPLFGWGILLAIVLAVAWHAGKCGYPPLLWIATGLLSGFPMANLAVLASLPDLRLEKERARLRRQTLQLVASPHVSRP